MLFTLICLLALTRAEIVQRLHAPVLTRANGHIRVVSRLSEPTRREYQGPVARFAGETYDALYGAMRRKIDRADKATLVIFLEETSSNRTDLITRVVTNGAKVVTRLAVGHPGYIDLDLFRAEIVRACARTAKGVELTRTEALDWFTAADPRGRVARERAKLERWLQGGGGDDEEAILLMNKVLEPGKAARRDILIFASHLFLYPRTFDEKFVGGADCLSFAEAIKCAKVDPRVRFLAYFKSEEMPGRSLGRGDGLVKAAQLYASFLRDLAAGEKDEKELEDELKVADDSLRTLLEKTK